MSDKPAAIVFCERIDNESFCESIVRELGATYEVRPFGPGWPVTRLADVPRDGARFYLELDSASGRFDRPEGLATLDLPKFAWLVDTHRKPAFHRSIAEDVDLTFFAMRTWGHVFKDRKSAWLPLHADTQIFQPRAVERDLDLVFVGSHGWRADPIREIARRHGLRVHVACTTGKREKTETAELYARARLVYNRHVSNDLNFRVFEATACGRVLLTDAQWNGQYELFEDRKHLVYYKDDRDLERLVIELLGNDGERASIEEAAAAHSARNHSTRARVQQLLGQIDAHLPAREPAVSVSAARRWLFFSDGAPGPITGKTYAERLGHALARRGEKVTIARERRLALPPAEQGAVQVLELDPGPVGTTHTPTNERLVSCAALHSRLATTVGGGSFDVVIAEGPRGGLIAQPLAERAAVPFVLALSSCEAATRGNRLTREQLYWAELEEWAAKRASLVLARDPAVLSGLERFYKSDRGVLAAPPRIDADDAASDLLDRLGVARDAEVMLVFGPRGAEREVAPSPTRVYVVATDETWLVTSAGGSWVSGVAPTGSVLSELVRRAKAAVFLEASDARLHEVAETGVPVAVAAGVGGRIESLVRRAAVRPRRDDDGLARLMALRSEEAVSCP